MMRRALALLRAAGLVLAAAACQPDDPCDPGHVEHGGHCYLVDGPPADAPTLDSAFAHFGDGCATDLDCAAPTTYCALPPGDSAGFCTRTECLPDPTMCPPEWTCLDVASYGAGFASLCIDL
jgi:hypothetical protein